MDEAVDRLLNGEGESEGYYGFERGWHCVNCGKWHPATHEECWYCRKVVL